jgi:hypothetical protein
VNIPDCHSRRELPCEDQFFYCAHPQFSAPGQRVWAAVCRACRLRERPPPETFRPFPPPPSALTDGPCRHLGVQTGLRECPTCRGRVRLKVFACGHPAHGETTLPECNSCRDYEKPLRANGIELDVFARVSGGRL